MSFDASSIGFLVDTSGTLVRGHFSSISCGQRSIDLPDVTDRVRAAFVCLTLNHGGAEHHLLKLGRALRGTRIVPTVIALDRGARNDLRSQFEADGITVMFPPYPRNHIGVIPWLAHLLRSGRVDVAHSFLWRPDVTLALAARLAGFRHVICSERGDRLTDEYWSADWRLRRLMDRMLTFTTARKLVSNSAAGLEAGVRAGCPRSKATLIYNWVNLPLIDSYRDAGREEGRRTGLGDRFVIGFVGRLSPAKGALCFVQMADAIASRLPDGQVVFLMVGDGPLRSQLEAEVRERGLVSRFVFTGAVDVSIPLIHAMDVGVICSPSESFPNVLLEFMACGKPVVSTRVGGIPDAIEDGISGRLLPCGSPEALADACVALARDSDAAVRMGAAARRTIEVKYQMAASIDQYVELYEQMARSDG
jgi:glycosyltransferase involved in cell wall biosynthesis